MVGAHRASWPGRGGRTLAEARAAPAFGFGRQPGRARRYGALTIAAAVALEVAIAVAVAVAVALGVGDAVAAVAWPLAFPYRRRAGRARRSSDRDLPGPADGPHAHRRNFGAVAGVGLRGNRRHGWRCLAYRDVLAATPQTHPRHGRAVDTSAARLFAQNQQQPGRARRYERY